MPPLLLWASLAPPRQNALAAVPAIAGTAIAWVGWTTISHMLASPHFEGTRHSGRPGHPAGLLASALPAGVCGACGGVSLLMSLKFSTALNNMLNSPKFCQR